MLKRLHNVRFSVFNPEKKKWITQDNMTVLLRDDLIYAVKAEPFHDACMAALDENEDFKKSNQSKEQRKKLAENCFREMLDECIISSTIQGTIYSPNTLWKVELEEHPYCDHGGDIEG